MENEQLFDSKNEGEEIIKMTPDEFVKKTKVILQQFDKEYATSWYNRKLYDAEYDLAPCEKCKGCGSFKNGDKEIECVQDREQGECHQRLFDHELFTSSIEQIMFGETDFYTLLQSRVEFLESNSLHKSSL